MTADRNENKIVVSIMGCAMLAMFLAISLHYNQAHLAAATITSMVLVVFGTIVNIIAGNIKAKEVYSSGHEFICGFLYAILMTVSTMAWLIGVFGVLYTIFYMYPFAETGAWQ